ncbi:hypothetical protein KQI01_02410, partial [Vibrio cholerae]|nr:hypothetical protein [Vibrio cholerae]
NKKSNWPLFFAILYMTMVYLAIDYRLVVSMIAPIGNEFIVLIKDSSLAAVIAAPELMYYARLMMGQYNRVWEPYLTVAV